MVTKLEVVPVCACACDKVVPVVNSQVSVAFAFNLFSGFLTGINFILSMFCICFCIFGHDFLPSFDTRSFYINFLICLEAQSIVTLFFTLFKDNPICLSLLKNSLSG